MSSIDKLRKFSIGCFGVFILLWMLPFIWMQVSRGIDDHQASRPPKPGTVEEVEFMARQGQREQALAKCLEYGKGAKEEPARLAFQEQASRLLRDLYHEQKQKRGKDAVDAIYQELAAKTPEPDAGLRDLWIRDKSDGIRNAIWKQEWATVEPQLEALRQAAGPGVSNALADLYRMMMDRRTAEFLSEDNAAGADAVAQAILKIPGYGQQSAVLDAYGNFLEQWMSREQGRGDMAGCGPVFDRLVAFMGQRSKAVNLGRCGRYLKQRLEQCIRNGDAAWPSAFFAAQIKLASPDDRRGWQQTYQEYQEQRWRAAAEQGNYTQMQGVLAEFAKQPDLLPADWCARQYAASLLVVWERERKANRKTEARQCLEQVIQNYVEAADFNTLVEAVRFEWSIDDVLARIEPALARQQLTVARVMLEAARRSANYTRQSPDMAPRVDAASLAYARARAAAALKAPNWEQFEDARNEYQYLLARPSFKARVEAWQAAGREFVQVLQEAARTRMGQGDLDEAERYLDDAIRKTAVSLWAEETRRTGTDPWQGIPPEVIQQVEKQGTAGDATARLVALEKMATAGDFVVPQAKAAAELRRQLDEARALQTVQNALKNLERGVADAGTLTALRAVFRRYPGTAAARQASEGLQGVIRTVGQAMGWRDEKELGGGSDFTLLSDVIGLYVAEVGVAGPKDPFAKELKERLLAAAAAAAKSAPKTRVFFLSLLADAMPADDADGQKARRDAMKLGLELMDRISGEGLQAPDTVFPSLVPGFSTMSVENKTPYHLMIFARGPEEFFVRMSPYRRGSIVLKDGTYDTAVIAAQEDVRPYRGQLSFKGEFQSSSYTVSESTAGVAPWMTGGNASGDYTLLRAPEGTGPLEVEPSTGIVMVDKKP